MYFKLTLIIIIAFLNFNCSEKKISPVELTDKIAKAYQTHPSLSYDIDYRIKFFSSIEDTTKISAKVDLVRVPEDSIFGGYVWINSDSIERYYDTDFLYYIDHKEKLITRYSKEKSHIIQSNTVGATIKTYFLNPQNLINDIADTTNTVELIDEMSDEKWTLKCLFPDDEYIENSWKNIWINKVDYSIHRMNFSADMQGENQYNQWNLSNIVFDKISIDDLKSRFSQLQDYQRSDYKEKPMQDIEPLKNEASIPNLAGNLYPDNTPVNLDDYKGHLVLLDFWYMDCFPCIKAIPHLNELHHKYKDKGLKVVGLNPINNNEKDLKRFPNFLEKNIIDYPIMFVERDDSKKMKVFIYPTLYLVDKNGKVLHSEIGFGEEIVSQIDSLIQVNL